MTFDDYWASFLVENSQPRIFNDAMREIGLKAWEAADRAAREECADVMQNLMLLSEDHSDDFAYNNALRQARHAIRKTITPASRQDDAQSAE
jgi:hypothetical protein